MPKVNISNRITFDTAPVDTIALNSVFKRKQIVRRGTQNYIWKLVAINQSGRFILFLSNFIGKLRNHTSEKQKNQTLRIWRQTKFGAPREPIGALMGLGVDPSNIFGVQWNPWQGFPNNRVPGFLFTAGLHMDRSLSDKLRQWLSDWVMEAIFII